MVGHKTIEDCGENTYQKMKLSNKLFFVKTHDPPEDNSKAIYIVRDGRASIVSYYHYLRDFESKKYPMFDVVTGIVKYGSWGAHLDVWDPISRPNTLLIQYERLLINSEEEIGRISNFLGLGTVRNWENDFAFFHEVEPRFFRTGHILKGIDEIQENDLDIFWLIHGDWMETLGYAKGEKKGKYNTFLLREITSKIYKRLLDNDLCREAALLNSLSWKVTAPLRTVWKIFKKN